MAPVCGVLGFIALFGALVFLIRWLGRVVHRSIEAFAKQHGLTYVDDKIRPHCEGVFDGRRVRVANEIGVYPWGFELRAMPMFVVYVSIEGEPAPRTWLGAQFGGAIHAKAPRALIEVNPSFDAEIFTITEDEVAARAWLTAPRQQAIRELVESFKRDGLIESDRVFIEEGQLVLRMTHMQKARASWIEEVVRALAAHAPGLDG